MFRNYLKVALRNGFKNKLVTFINIFSLALGIAACLLIYSFIRDERSFDTFHEKTSQIYRVDEIQSFPGTNTQKVALSMPGMGPNMLEDYPEVLNYTRFNGWGKQLVEKGDQRLMLERVASVDSTFLQIFDYKLLTGDKKTVLNEPNNIVITSETATIFFGNNNPIGESLRLRGEDFKITGVLEDTPENSHLQFDLLVSMAFHKKDNPNFDNQFGNNFLNTYLVMAPEADVNALESKMPDFITRHMPPQEENPIDANDFYKIFFQPLPEVHLASMDIEHDYQNYRKFNGSYLDIFAMVGLFILLIAGFNFMNLITARASHRWKEIGVRKSIGALKHQLFGQFAIESMFLGVVAFVIALIINWAATPFLNNLLDRKLSFSYFLENPTLLIAGFLLTVLLGFIAGIYPSYYLASYDPVEVLRGGNVKNNKSIFRSSLVVMQFGLAIAMIVSTLIVVQQLYFMQNKDIGFDKSRMMLLGMNQEANQKFDVLKQELKNNPLIKGVTASGQRIGNNFHQWGFKLKVDSIQQMTPSNVNVDYDYLEVYDIDIKQGRGFSKEYARDAGFAFIVNEAFAKEMNLENPVGVDAGHQWYEDDSLGTIIGVVEDFNFNSLHYKINTLSMVVHPEWGYDELSVKISGENVPAAIAHVERIWNEQVPSTPFNYSFLDEHFEELYKTDQQMESVVSIMALLAIFIACMGLFGLAAITTERKIKEIGIRKVLGASVPQIMISLSKNFAMMIGLAFLIFSPFTYFFMQNWLENFAYSIDINPMVFLLGGFLATLIALLTISYHTFRSARANPIKALKVE